MDFDLIAQFSIFDPSNLWAIFQMVLGLGFVIFVHELGHFLVAKACGVKCEKFYLGFDAFDIKIGDRVLIPRKLVHWKWGETEYGVGILPLGGYVKMLGQDDNPAQIAEERKRSLEQDEALEDEAPKLDPRSYQAKPVIQRMAIISAGVIMNLIFAVIFASIAFGTSVNYEPPQVGSTIPGSPAWQHNLDGTSVLNVGEQTTQKRYFTFGHLREAIVFDGKKDGINLSVLRPPTELQISQEPFDNSTLMPVDLRVNPAPNLIDVKGAESLMAIGIGPAMSLGALGTPPVVEGSAASKAQPPFETGDRIVSVAGKSILRNLVDENGRPYKQYSVYLFRMLLAQHSSETVDVVVERKNKTTKAIELVTIKMPPAPMKTIGIEMDLGRVQAVQFGSPAEVAGIQAGDKLESIDGKSIGDPFTLDARMQALARENKTVAITVYREKAGEQSVKGSLEGETLDLKVKPRLIRAPDMVHMDRATSFDSLGIAAVVSNDIVATSLKDRIGENSKVVKVQFFHDEKDKEKFSAEAAKPMDLVKNPNRWSQVNAIVQNSNPGTKIELTLEKGQETSVVEVSIAQLDGFFQVSRGFPIAPEQMNYQAQSFSEAVQLGLNQTWSDGTKVVKFLGKLIRGDIPITGLGGPGTIVMAATSEASQGTSRLLLFLTLLSANLAVINFLPIPILDGGHMVFLAYEGIFRRPVSERVQIILSFGGLIFIVGLMLLVISLDVWRWSGLF